MPPLFLICALYSSPAVPFASPQTASAHSVSGQFVVQRVATTARVMIPPDLANNKDYLKLEPALTAVSCERIKRALLDSLGDKSQWRGKIHLVLYPAQSADDGVAIISEQFKDGWRYRLELPDLVERRRFVRAVVQTLLLEMAGRNARDRSPEIPAWLVEGLAQHLLMANENELFLTPPRWAVNGLTIKPTMVDRRGRDPLETARRTLRERPPLTLAELSWPTDEQFDGPAGEVYRSSAQLFVSELLRLKDGRTSLRAMLDGLATCYNWQTAFLGAFQAHFERQVDLEKWWALQVEHFTGRNPDQTWSPAESWSKLNEILRTPVDVRHSHNDLPGRAEISLATVVREWDVIRQNQTLPAKLRELKIVRLRVSQNLIALVDDYCRVLSSYLERRERAGLILPGSKIPAANVNIVVRSTLKELAALETRREALRPRSAPVSAAQTETDLPKPP